MAKRESFRTTHTRATVTSSCLDPDVQVVPEGTKLILVEHFDCRAGYLDGDEGWLLAFPAHEFDEESTAAYVVSPCQPIQLAESCRRTQSEGRGGCASCAATDAPSSVAFGTFFLFLIGRRTATKR